MAYFIFLVFLTYASVECINEYDPTTYDGPAEYARLVAEIVVGLVLLGVLTGELIEMYELRYDMHE